MFDKLNEMKNEMAELKRKYVEEGEKSFNSIIQFWFGQNPEVKAIVWEQYTPYFNDGEPCVFGVNEPVFVTKEYDEYDERSYNYEEDDVFSWKYNPNNKKGSPSPFREELIKNCKEVKDFIQQNDELFEAMFGDHVKVVLRPGEEPETYEYDHD